MSTFIVSCIRLINSFFNLYIRDSESTIVCFFWTTGVLFGWVKFLFELKNITEFLIRHVIWGVWWKRQLNYTNQRNREHVIKDLKKYGQNRPLY